MLFKDFFKINTFKIIFTLIFSIFIIIDVVRHIIITTPISTDFVSYLSAFLLVPVMSIANALIPLVQNFLGAYTGLVIVVLSLIFYYLVSCVIMFLYLEINSRIHVVKEKTDIFGP